MVFRFTWRARILLGAFSLSLVSPLSAGDLIQFPSAQKGRFHQAELVPVDAEGLYVTVGVVGADVSKGQSDGEAYQFLAQDPGSRLTLLRGPKGAAPASFASGRDLKGGDLLMSLPDKSGAAIRSRVVGWGATFGNQQLPLTFLRMNHSGQPHPGHPLLNDKGEVVALCHQSTTDLGKGSFAVPSDAVRRILANYASDKSIGHSWLGLHLDVRNTVAYVVGTRPDSPAQKFGFQKGDVLLRVGDWDVFDYSSAINAFYYLLPNKEVDFKILRGLEVKVMKVTPVSHPASPAGK